MLNGFLEHLSRDKSLRKNHGSQVCGCVLSQWGKLGSWWGERFSADQRLGTINLLKKLLSLEPKVHPCLVVEQEREEQERRERERERRAQERGREKSAGERESPEREERVGDRLCGI